MTAWDRPGQFIDSHALVHFWKWLPVTTRVVTLPVKISLLLASPAVCDSESTKLVVPLLLSRLKQATLSSLNRKRKVYVAENLPLVGKRRKPYWCSSEPRSVTPEQRVRGFPDEALVTSAKKLFCTACIEELAWWQKHATEIPRWSCTACKVILAQPSSAAAEWVFSLLNCLHHNRTWHCKIILNVL